jgi:hypothetical protein
MLWLTAFIFNKFPPSDIYYYHRDFYVATMNSLTYIYIYKSESMFVGMSVCGYVHD